MRNEYRLPLKTQLPLFSYAESSKEYFYMTSENEKWKMAIRAFFQENLIEQIELAKKC